MEYELFDSKMETIYTVAPRGAQCVGARALFEHQHCMLLYDCGLGKTYIALSHYQYLKKFVDPTYKMCVIVPQRLVFNWQEEVNIFYPELTVCLLHGGTAKKLKALRENPDADIYVTNVEGISPRKGQKKSFFEQWKSFLSGKKFFGVVDESTTIKNPTSKRTKSVLELRDYFSKRVCMTGTFLPNSWQDAYSQLEFLYEGASGCGNWWGFKSRYCECKNPYIPAMVTGYRNIDQLKEVIKGVSSSALKEDWLDLPDKIYNKVYIEPTKEQIKLFSELKETCFTEFQGIEIEKTHVLAKMQLFLQASKGFLMYDALNENDDVVKQIKYISNNRYDVLVEMLQAELKDQPTIIWSSHIEERNLILKMLKGNKIKAVRLDNTLTGAEGQAVIKKFQSGKIKILVVSQQSFSYGVTLTAAKNVIYFSNSYDYLLRSQSEDRCHRIGTKHSVNYYDFILKDSIDEVILQCLKGKDDVLTSFNNYLKE